MFQTFNGLKVFVVDFDTMPELPITGVGDEEPYARALTAAIEEEVIKEPGKYGIHVYFTFDGTLEWNVFNIIE